MIYGQVMTVSDVAAEDHKFVVVDFIESIIRQLAYFLFNAVTLSLWLSDTAETHDENHRLTARLLLELHPYTVKQLVA